MATAASPAVASSHFFDALSRRNPGVLVIDYETTLAQLGREERKFPYPTVEELLDRIGMTGTRLILASSRTKEELRARFNFSFEILPPPVTAALEAIAGGKPLAHVCGAGRSEGQRLLVRTEYRLATTKVTAGAAEDMVQFLLDWLRACTREV